MPASDESSRGYLICAQCGERMVAEHEMTAHQRHCWEMIQWQQGVMARGQWGPSPGGAAAELGCSRATVDDLVSAGILERNEFPVGNQFLVLISERSIKRALDNKKRTGRWTGIPGEHHEYE